MKLISAYSSGNGAITFKLEDATDKQILKLAAGRVHHDKFFGYLERAVSDIGHKDVFVSNSSHVLGIKEGVLLFTECFVESTEDYLKNIEDLGGDRILVTDTGCVIMYQKAYLWKSDVFTSPQVELVVKGEITFNQIF